MTKKTTTRATTTATQGRTVSRPPDMLDCEPAVGPRQESGPSPKQSPTHDTE
jgi:hypothetical protein